MSMTISDLFIRIAAEKEQGLHPDDPVYVYDFNSRQDTKYEKGEIAGLINHRTPTVEDIETFAIEPTDIVLVSSFEPSKFSVSELELLVCTLLDAGLGGASIFAHRAESNSLLRVEGAETAFFEITDDRYLALLVDIVLSLVG